MKLQISVSDDMCKRIDAVAEKYGCTRSALCSVLLGQAIAGCESAFSVVDKVAETVLSDESKTTPLV